MIYYRGIINGEKIILQVDNNNFQPTYIDFADDDIEIIKICEKERKKEEIIKLKQKLSDTDYIACKLAEGEATREEYAFELEQRRNWRAMINQLEDELNS